MKTQEQEHENATNSQSQTIEDPDLNVSRFFALLYSIDQRNKEEKDVINKSGDSPHTPTKGASSLRKLSSGVHKRPNGSGYRISYPTKKIGSSHLYVHHPMTRELSHEIEHAIATKAAELFES